MLQTELKPVSIGVQRLSHALPELPQYQTTGAAGMDLQAAISESWTLAPMERKLVPTGLVLELPEGYEAQVRARSGLSAKHGITLINGIGTIDWDYRQELKVALVNLSQDAYTLQPGERIAQLVIAPVTRAVWVELEQVQDASDSGRSGGFGSTGK